jgi:hypothetical protein
MKSQKDRILQFLSSQLTVASGGFDVPQAYHGGHHDFQTECEVHVTRFAKQKDPITSMTSQRPLQH